jgi:hypothetical protein
MYNLDKRMMGYIFILTLVLTYWLPEKFDYKNIINNAIVFISILGAFYTTTMSILMTSEYVTKKLVKITDSNNKGKNLLETLIAYYKVLIILSGATILFLIIISGLEKDNLILRIALPLVSINAYGSKKLLDIFVKSFD